MIIVVPVSVENAYLTSIANALDAQSTPGKFQLYSGTRPAGGGALSGNTKIIEWVLPKPCAASIADGVLTFNTIAYSQTLANSAHTFARGVDGADNWVVDLDTGVLNVPLADGSLAAWQFDAASYPVGALLIPTVLALKFPG